MPGFGTIINTAAVIVGGILGMGLGGRLNKRFQDTLMMANAVAVLFIGMGGAFQHMFVIRNGALETSGTMMVIGSLAIGAITGELLNIEHHMKRFGEWIKQKTGNTRDVYFVEAFVTCSLTICIGAMAIVGAIEDGISGDHSILFAKAVLDLIIVAVMTASMGKGCIFAAIPILLFQGIITMMAGFIAPYITDGAMANLSYIGSILIFCVGVNLMWEKKIRVANLLPSLIVAVVWSAFM